MSSLQILKSQVNMTSSKEVVNADFGSLNGQFETGIALAPEKNVSVERDERYTRIFIDKKVEKHQLNEKYSDLYLKVKIIKDRFLKTTETHIQKMFVSYETLDSEDLDVIIRDIYVDRSGKRSKRDSNTARKRMKRSHFLEAFSQNIAPQTPVLMLD